MRFKAQFSRFVGGGPPGSVALGADVTPTTEVPDPLTQTHLMTTPVVSEFGEVCQRIAVSCSAPPGAPALPANAFFYEEATARWYKLNSTPLMLTSGELYDFDFPRRWTMPDESAVTPPRLVAR